ncbi:amino-acid N-acetyltransferase [Nevskia sp.]|uniref:amino-acid N-acetyltransferase n=1 Tax=Nevskia sp. TaxID=1929292 RepID=UPI0025F6324E|nr:amino-acid N-acetyltransferase [Nevskia sp.]
MNPDDFVAALRGAAPYVHAHNGRTFVIAFGGEAALREDFERFIHDLALLHSLGVRLVLVHGVRPQIEAQLAARQIAPQFSGDLRITDAPTMECVKAAVGILRMDIEARLSTGLASTPMGGARLKVAGGNWVTARPVGVRDGVDHLLTGEVRRIDVASIENALDEGRIAVLSPIGYSPTGETFNLRAGDVAQAVATGLKADKLVFLLNADPDRWQLADDTGDAGQLPLREAEKLLARPAIQASLSPEDRALLQSALAAGRGGVERVHLIGSEPSGALLRELYTRDGCGLMFHADDNYEAVREASIEDIGGILALIQPLEAAGVLVARSREQLEIEISLFDVMVRDGTVIACAALIPFPEDAVGEFSCVAVHPDYRREGRAEALLKRAEESAASLGITRLFALTTHTPHWFIEHGFVAGTPNDLPAAKARLYNWQRKSMVLVKTL